MDIDRVKKTQDIKEFKDAMRSIYSDFSVDPFINYGWSQFKRRADQWNDTWGGSRDKRFDTLNSPIPSSFVNS